MSELPHIPPLPSPDDYRDATVEIGHIFNRHGHVLSIDKYMTKTGHYDHMKQFLAQSAQLGVALERRDAKTGHRIDPQAQAAHAFIRGAKAGLMIAEHVHHDAVAPHLIYDALGQIEVDDTMTLPDKGKLIAREMFRLSRLGIALTGAVSARNIGNWAEHTLPDGAFRTIFTVGIGLVINGAQRQHEQRREQYEREQLNAMQVAAARVHDYDWDAGFERLLDVDNQ